MKKGIFLATFICAHIAFIFLQIYKHMQFIKYSFAKQKYEKQLEQLQQKKVLVQNNLYAQQNRASVKEFAESELGMTQVKLSQVKRLNSHDR